jgi:hypothetical protein
VLLFDAKISEISVYADKMLKFVLKNNPVFFLCKFVDRAKYTYVHYPYENEEWNDQKQNVFVSVTFVIFRKYPGTTKKEQRG